MQSGHGARLLHEALSRLRSAHSTVGEPLWACKVGLGVSIQAVGRYGDRAHLGALAQRGDQVAIAGTRWRSAAMSSGA
jgi:hypothetical protein